MVFRWIMDEDRPVLLVGSWTVLMRLPRLQEEIPRQRQLPNRWPAVTPFLLGFGAFLSLHATTPTDAELERSFKQTVRPFLATYCTGCHSGASPAATLDLLHYSSLESVVKDAPHWALVQRKLLSNQMPPRALAQPTAEVRKEITSWIEAVRRNTALKNAGDPGPVLARRLSNAEFNNTIRDLTGVDLKPAREFPVDPANEAGFDNSGESLTISPALMSKYLEAARQVSDHLVLKPDGMAFANHFMLVETDREKYAIQRIVAFYDTQPTDFADYFQAAWRYKNRAALGYPAATLASIAAQSKVSPKYLPMVWQTLEEANEDVGPLVKLQAMWRALPAAKNKQPDAARAGCVEMRDFVVKIRRHTEKLFNNLDAPGFNANFQPVAMYRNHLLATHHRDFEPLALRVEGEPAAPEFVVTRGPTFGGQEDAELKRSAAVYQKERLEDPDLLVPAGQRARYEAAFARFSSVFPTVFCLREKGRFYPITSMDKGRLLGAGLHNVMGYYRDDQALIELILDERGKQELDKLWQDFEFIGDYTTRTYSQFVYNGGDGSRRGVVVDRPSVNTFSSAASIAKMRDQYLAKANTINNSEIVKAIKTYFDNTNDAIRWVEKARLDAEQRHLDSLLKLAARAYRRPLTIEDRDDILAYYRELRQQRNLSHEEAMRGSVTSILISPEFLYRVDMVKGATIASVKTAPQSLSNYSLASRLSFFLWSSMPDEELMARAEAGDLAKPAVLTAQVRRMLKDDRARGLATEFAGNWLDFRRFEDHNGVDRARFPAFTNELREAMFQEPVRLISDVIQNDRSVLNLLYGNYTFVNPALAQYYGMPPVAGGADHWIQVDNARLYGRGGLLPMAVFLTTNASGLRTSPVKRGHWIAQRVLGEVIPPPPAVVPELPKDEATMDLPVREMLAKHRENPICASCHARFDSFGIAFEGYGPAGEKRSKDMGGRLVDARTQFPGGQQGDGMEGLLTYIRANREQDFLINISEKMLVFALGRQPLITDDELLAKMRTRLSAGGYRMSVLIETIVNSPQFLTKRSPQFSQNVTSESYSQR